MVKNKLGREIEFTVTGQYSDDLFIEEAYYADTGEPLSDKEIDELQETHADKVYEAWMDNMVSSADFYDYE
jgi:hypothetical protein